MPRRAASLVGVPGDVVLNPRQQKVLDDLGARGDDRPSFPADLAATLQARLDEQLLPLTEHREEPLRVPKHLLSSVHGCERQFLANQSAPFVISVRTVVGSVAHKAIELSQHWDGEPLPAGLAACSWPAVKASASGPSAAIL